MRALIFVIVAGVAVARADAPQPGAQSREPRLYVEAGGVVATPQSSIYNLDTGLGIRIATGVDWKHLGVWAGYRRLWTKTHSFGEDISIWTRDVMLGGRIRYGVAFLDGYVSHVVLDSELGRGSSWHHRGTGIGGRLGIAVPLARRFESTFAIGECFAETKYDDMMGVAWLSAELTVTGRW